MWLAMIMKVALLGSVTVAKTSESYRGRAVELDRYDRAGCRST